MIIKHVLATVQSQIRGAVTFSANGFLWTWRPIKNLFSHELRM